MSTVNRQQSTDFTDRPGNCHFDRLSERMANSQKLTANGI